MLSSIRTASTGRATMAAVPRGSAQGRSVSVPPIDIAQVRKKFSGVQHGINVRYGKLHNQIFVFPIINRDIPVIGERNTFDKYELSFDSDKFHHNKDGLCFWLTCARHVDPNDNSSPTWDYPGFNVGLKVERNVITNVWQADKNHLKRRDDELAIPFYLDRREAVLEALRWFYLGLQMVSGKLGAEKYCVNKQNPDDRGLIIRQLSSLLETRAFSESLFAFRPL